MSDKDPYEEIEVQVFNQAVAHIDDHIRVNGSAAIIWAEKGMPEEHKTLYEAMRESMKIRTAAGDVKKFKKAFVLWCKQIIKVSKGYAAYCGKG